METLTLRLYPDKILSAPAREVVETDLINIGTYIPEMIKIMASMNGVGIAANQVGLDLSFALIDLTKDAWHNKVDPATLVLINPKIISEKDPVRITEGCLSLPGFNELVTRPSTVVVEYQDLEWKLQTKELTGLMAQCAVHELLHLRGVLLIDEMSAMVKEMYKKKLRKSGLL